jgi:hypothetical protein
MSAYFSKIVVLVVFWSAVVACDQKSSTEQLKKPEVVNKKDTSWSNAFEKYNGVLALSGRFSQQKGEYDFNGDGQKDYIYYADVLKDIKGLTDASVIQPWLPMGSQTVGAKTALLIVHGGEGGAVVIHDKNDLSILDTSAMMDSAVIPKSKITALEEPDLTAEAKGDIILVPTEAGIDSYIYWSGVDYKLYEVIDIP